MKRSHDFAQAESYKMHIPDSLWNSFLLKNPNLTDDVRAVLGKIKCDASESHFNQVRVLLQSINTPNIMTFNRLEFDDFSLETLIWYNTYPSTSLRSSEEYKTVMVIKNEGDITIEKVINGKRYDVLSKEYENMVLTEGK